MPLASRAATTLAPSRTVRVPRWPKVLMIGIGLSMLGFVLNAGLLTHERNQTIQRVAHHLMDPARHAGPDAPAWARLDTCVNQAIPQHPTGSAYGPDDAMAVVGPCQIRAQVPGVEVVSVEAKMVESLGPRADRENSLADATSPSAPGNIATAVTVLRAVCLVVLVALVVLIVMLVGFWNRRSPASNVVPPTMDPDCWWHAYRGPLDSGKSSSDAQR